MIDTSQEYKDSMKSAVRNRGYMRLIIGGFDSDLYEAVRDGDIEASGDGTYFSADNVAFTTNHEGLSYATLENRHTRVDGLMLFPPRSDSELPYICNEWVSEDDLAENTITLTFYSESRIKCSGITIVIGDVFTHLTRSVIIGKTSGGVETVVQTLTTHTANTRYGSMKLKWNTAIDTGTGADLYWIRISAAKSSSDHSNDVRRLRIQSVILGGDAVVFTDDDIIETSDETILDKSKTIYPQYNFDASIQKYELYNSENPYADNSYLTYGNNIKAYYGYLLPSTDIEWIKGYDHAIQTINTDETTIQINAYGVAPELMSMYPYGSEGKTLKAQFLDVCTFLGIGSGSISGLNNLPDDEDNPIPVPYTFCWEAMNFISSAGRCLLRYSRDRNVILSPDYSNVTTYRMEKQDMMSYPVKQIVQPVKEIQVSYYTHEPDYKITNVYEEERYYSSQEEVTVNFPESRFVELASVTDVDTGTDITSLVIMSNVTISSAKLKFNIITTMHLRVVLTGMKISDFDTLVDLRSISLTANVPVLFDWDSPHYFAYLAYASYGNVSITDYGRYYAKISAPATETVGRITIKGVPTKINELKLTIPVNDTGEIIKWENPMIYSQDQALAVGNWLKDFYTGVVDYSYSTRGNPELDPGDIIYQDNQYDNNMQVRVLETRLDYNGAFSGSVKVEKVVE